MFLSVWIFFLLKCSVLHKKVLKELVYLKLSSKSVFVRIKFKIIISILKNVIKSYLKLYSTTIPDY